MSTRQVGKFWRWQSTPQEKGLRLFPWSVPCTAHVWQPQETGRIWAVPAFSQFLRRGSLKSFLTLIPQSPSQGWPPCHTDATPVTFLSCLPLFLYSQWWMTHRLHREGFLTILSNSTSCLGGQVAQPQGAPCPQATTPVLPAGVHAGAALHSWSPGLVFSSQDFPILNIAFTYILFVYWLSPGYQLVVGQVACCPRGLA